MEEKEFEKRAYETLKQLEKALTDLDDRLEADLASDVLTLEFSDGRKYIVNSHRVARQIWFAANANAWHFSPDEVSGKWIDTRGGLELLAVISEALSKNLGRTIQLKLS
jgi:CyaY protein